MVMLVMGASYCLMHLGHWPALRDYANILDKKNWDLFALYAAVLWVTALVGLPALMLLLAGVGRQLAGCSQSTRSLMTASTGALVPFGLMLWITFVVPMLMVDSSFVLQSRSDPFGWGWDSFSTSSMP
jgi:hypothetical protein